VARRRVRTRADITQQRDVERAVDSAVGPVAAKILRALRGIGTLEKKLVVDSKPFALTIRASLSTGMSVGKRSAAKDAPARIAREAAAAAARTTETARAAKWAEKRSAALVVDVTKGVRAAIRVATSDALARGQHAGALARELRDVIGLDERRATAVVNFRTAQIEAGVDAKVVEARTSKYADRLLAQRAEVIARTEIFAAIAQGRNEFWRELISDGVVEAKDITRTWVASGAENMCPICEDLDGETAGLGEEFKGGYDAPPSHTACVCSVTYEVA
jgi:hypothetical protein